MSNVAGLIESSPLFSGLNEKALGVLAGEARLESFPKGSTLWKAGTRARGLFVLVEGQVRVVRRAGGKQYTLHRESAGGTLGEVPLFSEDATPATAWAARNTQCLVFPRELIRSAIEADAELAFRLLKRMANRVHTFLRRLDDRTSTTVSAGLAALLLQRHAEARGGPFRLGATQTEVAEELGTVREVVVRALRQLRQDEMIKAVKQGVYRVVDATALRTRAAKVTAVR